jgi:prephenate dehydrogenase
MVQYFKDAGFDVDILGIDKWDKILLSRNALNSQFKYMPDAELRVSGFDVILKKPAG